MLLSVAALPCAAALLLGLLPVLGAAAGGGEVGASGGGADGEGPASGHGRLPIGSVPGLGVVSMKASGALGVFVVGLVVFLVGVAREFTVVLLVIGGLLMLGAVAATAGRRRTGPDPEVTMRPGGDGRPWRRG